MLYLSDLYRKQHHPSLSVLILFSPHLPIGSSCFGLQHLCFQTCVLTGPHLALLSGTPLPKRIKLISTLHAASILKCHCSETSFPPFFSLSHRYPPGFSLLSFVFHIPFPVPRFLWKTFLWNCCGLMQLKEDKSCAVIDYTSKRLKRFVIVKTGLISEMPPRLHQSESLKLTPPQWFMTGVHFTLLTLLNMLYGSGAINRPLFSTGFQMVTAGKKIK